MVSIVFVFRFDNLHQSTFQCVSVRNMPRNAVKSRLEIDTGTNVRDKSKRFEILLYSEAHRRARSSSILTLPLPNKLGYESILSADVLRNINYLQCHVQHHPASSLGLLGYGSLLSPSGAHVFGSSQGQGKKAAQAFINLSVFLLVFMYTYINVRNNVFFRYINPGPG